MLQPRLLFSDSPIYPGTRKKDQKTALELNSTALAEREGVTATSLVRPKGEKALIHRVPSREGATATSLVTFQITHLYKKTNRKNAPYRLSLCNNNKTRKRAYGA